MQMIQAAISSDTWNSDGTPKILVEIPNLRQVAGVDNAFELEGVVGREIDWDLLARAIKVEAGMDDRLREAIFQAIFKHDIIEFFSKNCKLV